MAKGPGVQPAEAQSNAIVNRKVVVGPIGVVLAENLQNAVANAAVN